MSFTMDANTGKGCSGILVCCYILRVCRCHSFWNHFFQNRHCAITNTQITQVVNSPIISSQRVWSLRGWGWRCHPHCWWLRRWGNSIWRKKQHASIIVMAMPKHEIEQMLSCILQRVAKSYIQEPDYMNKNIKFIIGNRTGEGSSKNTTIHNTKIQTNKERTT